MHYVTDAIAGAFVGAGCLVVALMAIRVGQLVATRQARTT
jgi:membrane-associated phospholipid phosphatase